MKRFLLFSFLSLQLSFVQAQKVTFSLAPDKTTVAIGDTFTVNINVKNFTRMFSTQFALKFDNTNYQFIQSNRQALPIKPNGDTTNYGVNYVRTTSLWILSWETPNLATSSTLVDTTLIRLRLRALKSGAVTNICFVPESSYTEIVQYNSSGQFQLPVEAEFTGLNCGFGFSQNAAGTKTFTPRQVAVSDVVNIKSNVYPNPFKSDFTIVLQTPIVGEVTVMLFDVLGRQVFSQKEQARPSILIHTAHLPTGLYNYQIQTQQGISVGKILKK